MRNVRSPIADNMRVTRREFLRTSALLSASAGSMALLSACGVSPIPPGAQASALETTTVRLVQATSVCLAPQYLAEDFLKKDGFTDVQYTKISPAGIIGGLATGEADMSMTFAPVLVRRLDAGDPVVALAGVHVGCFVLFGSEHIDTIYDLKGSNVAITEIGGSEHAFLSTMAAFVGIDPNKDINWITHPVPESKQLFIDGKLDAFLAFPPIAQELRAKQVGHEVLNSMMDKPWSQYYCCILAANRDFTQKNPEATKRVVRSILKATDLCSQEPERAAQLMVDRGFTSNYDYTLDAMKEIPYGVWRDYDAVDTLRFYALKLRDIGMVKGSPDEIIANGADWHFLNELKAELKG